MIRSSSSCRQIVGLVLIVAVSLKVGNFASAQTEPDVQRGKSQIAQDAASLREAALTAMAADNDDKAFQLARTAMRVAPDDPQVIFLMALLLGERQRFPEAIKLLDDLAEKVPSSKLPVLGQTAEWMVKYGQWADAENRYRTILANVPDSVLVHRNLAHLLLRQGRRTEAASHLRQMCRLGDIREGELRPLLMLVYPFAADAEKQEFDPITDLTRAQIELSKGNWDAVGKKLKSLSEPNAAEVALLGRIYAHQQDAEALKAWAAENAEPAHENNEHADYWFALGAYHALQGDHVNAVKCFCDAVVYNHTDKESYQLMGQSLKALNASAEAERAFKRAEMIETTQELGAEMAADKTRDYEKMSSLIDLMEKLHRPFEALAWRGVRLAYGKANASLSDEQAQQVLSGIVRDLSKQRQSTEDQPTKQFLICGVDLDSLKPASDNDAAPE